METMGKHAFFLGCMIPLRLGSVELAARRVFSQLNVEFLDLEGYTCCPEPVALALIDKELWVTAAARNLALAEMAGADLVVLCSGCYETLIEADDTLRHDDEIRKRVNELLASVGRKYEGKIKIKHFIEFLHEDVGLNKIKEEISTPVEMNLAIHYGCHLSREVDGSDPERKPQMMRNLVEASGAQLSDYGLEKVCCGFPISQFDKEFSLKERLLPKLRSIENTAAEAIVFDLLFRKDLIILFKRISVFKHGRNRMCLRKMDRRGLTELHPCEARLCEKGRAWLDFLKALLVLSTGHALTSTPFRPTSVRDVAPRLAGEAGQGTSYSF